MRFSTKAIHAGQEPDPATGATIVPIYQTSTFTQDAVGRHKGWEYSRSGNPTRQALETCLAALEGATNGLAFASGLAAETAVLSLVRPGDHVVASADLYGGTVRLFDRVFVPMGIEFSYVDDTSAESFAAARRPSTRLFWTETPSNPLLQLTDIAAVADVAHEAGASLVVDNTFASPFLQRPLALGADIVVHSTTKYIGGHSDVVGGAVLTSDDDASERLRFYQNAAGSVPGPFDSWLTLRGAKTLAVRMRRHVENALELATFLEGQDGVEVFYPGLPGHPQAELVSRQMPEGAGGIVSIRLQGGAQSAHRFVEALEVFSLAESLGGVESLICMPCAMTHASIPEEVRSARGVTDDLLRLSVGIEDVEDLLEDVARGLAAAKT